MNGTALVCDDDPLFRTLAGRILTDAGWTVVASAEHAVDAINIARMVHPDLVILDISMPGLSGLDAIPELIELGSVVVVCTAFATSAAMAADKGAVALVDKSDLATLAGVLATIPGAPAGAR